MRRGNARAVVESLRRARFGLVGDCLIIIIVEGGALNRGKEILLLNLRLIRKIVMELGVLEDGRPGRL